MRITTNTNDTATATTNDSKMERLPYMKRQASKLLTIADRLGSAQKTYHVKTRLQKWSEADAERSEAHNNALTKIDQAVAALQFVAGHLEALPEGYAPGAPKKARGGSKFEIGAPVGVKEAKLEEYVGLIEDPRCLKVVEVRKSVVLVETTDGLRVPLPKASLEAIA